MDPFSFFLTFEAFRIRRLRVRPFRIRSATYFKRFRAFKIPTKLWMSKNILNDVSIFSTLLTLLQNSTEKYIYLGHKNYSRLCPKFVAYVNSTNINLGPWWKNQVSPDSQNFGESHIKLVSIRRWCGLSHTIYPTEEDWCYICASIETAVLSAVKNALKKPWKMWTYLVYAPRPSIRIRQ